MKGRTDSSLLWEWSVKNFKSFFLSCVLMIIVSAFAVWNFLYDCESPTIFGDAVVSKPVTEERPPHPVPPPVLELSPVPFVGELYYQKDYWIQELRHGWILIHRYKKFMVFVPKPDVPDHGREIGEDASNAG
jgi:hypothetical protein